jgi:hypothetical protein
VKRRLFNILVALDQLVYVLITLGHGQPDETMSAAAWRLESKGQWFGKLVRPAIDALFFWDPDHCYHAAMAEVNRTQGPKL